MSREETTHEVDVMLRCKGHSGLRVYGDVDFFGTQWQAAEGNRNKSSGVKIRW